MFSGTGWDSWSSLGLNRFWWSDSSLKFIKDPGNIIHSSEESGQQGGVSVKIALGG